MAKKITRIANVTRGFAKTAKQKGIASRRKALEKHAKAVRVQLNSLYKELGEVSERLRDTSSMKPKELKRLQERYDVLRHRLAKLSRIRVRIQDQRILLDKREARFKDSD
ncbi:MAG: hypothetical protein QXK06_03655 [Candidatus Diapherotrites archaeon]